jgi:S1-C subfamily serine protease
VVPHSPADRAGLQTLDRLLSINGKANLSQQDLERSVESPGQSLAILVERNGVLQTKHVELPPPLR